MRPTTNDAVLQRLSGLIDLLIAIQKKGITIPGSYSRSSAPASPAQRSLRTKFQQAVYYAQSLFANEPLRLLYSGKVNFQKSAYHLAVADFLKAPQIGNIDVSGYHGQAGSGIIIPVTDDIKVAAVKAKIESSDHSLLEEGDAALQGDGVSWLYIATQFMALAVINIIVTASDLPGHLSTRQKIM